MQSIRDNLGLLYVENLPFLGHRATDCKNKHISLTLCIDLECVKSGKSDTVELKLENRKSLRSAAMKQWKENSIIGSVLCRKTFVGSTPSYGILSSFLYIHVKRVKFISSTHDSFIACLYRNQRKALSWCICGR